MSVVQCVPREQRMQRNVAKRSSSVMFHLVEILGTENQIYFRMFPLQPSFSEHVLTMKHGLSRFEGCYSVAGVSDS